jgi:hypothetical protein
MLHRSATTANQLPIPRPSIAAVGGCRSSACYDSDFGAMAVVQVAYSAASRPGLSVTERDFLPVGDAPAAGGVRFRGSRDHTVDVIRDLLPVIRPPPPSPSQIDLGPPPGDVFERRRKEPDNDIPTSYCQVASCVGAVMHQPMPNPGSVIPRCSGRTLSLSVGGISSWSLGGALDFDTRLP